MAIAMVSVVLTGAARADTSTPLSLAWSSANDPDCPDRDAMLAEVARMLGPSDGARKSVTVDGKIERRSAGDYRISLSLSTDDTHADRTFKATTCREGSAAAALIVALAVDARAKPTDKPFSAPAPAAPATVASTPKPPVVPAPPPNARAPLRPRRPGLDTKPGDSVTARTQPRTAFGLAIGGRVASGAQPSAVAGGEIGIWANVTRLRFEAWFALSASSRATVDPPIGPTALAQGGDFSSLSWGGRVCVPLPVGPVAVGPCASAVVVRTEGLAFGTERSSRDSAMWATLGGDAIVVVPLGSRFAVRGTLGVAAALDRPTFVVLKPEAKIPVFRPDAAALSGSLGIEVRFF